MNKLNIVNNPQFDLRYFTRNDKYVISEFIDGKYTNIEEGILEDSTPFVLSFRLVRDNGRTIHKDVSIGQYANRLINIYKVVIA